jgi:dienelactone hydrolase
MALRSAPATTPLLVPVAHQWLHGDLGIPCDAAGLVLFAHGSGSSRHSPRNQFVARALERHGLATLLIDLLTPQEEAFDLHSGRFRFDINLLAGRLVAIIDWLRGRAELASLELGLFGASTGAGAALKAAAIRPDQVKAVVSRGGRPDLAEASLPHVSAPTLLIVGGDDEPVIEVNREAMRRITAEIKLAIVPGATHLFEEPGALERVAVLAGDWFAAHLQPSPTPQPAHTSASRSSGRTHD